MYIFSINKTGVETHVGSYVHFWGGPVVHLQIEKESPFNASFGL